MELYDHAEKYVMQLIRDTTRMMKHRIQKSVSDVQCLFSLSSAVSEYSNRPHPKMTLIYRNRRR